MSPNIQYDEPEACLDALEYEVCYGFQVVAGEKVDFGDVENKGCCREDED